MDSFSRRTTLQLLLALAASPALAKPRIRHTIKEFHYDDLIKKAENLSLSPYEEPPLHLPGKIDNLDFDSYRNIRFRKEKSFLNGKDSSYRMQLFHLGFLYRDPVTINIINNGIPIPIPYRPDLFDSGKTRIGTKLPANTGFAGFRLHYPLNDPLVFDELIAFLGASYFRFLGRDQHYGLSARGIALNVADGRAEEFPRFREFWVTNPPPASGHITIYALLDGPSLTGAYQFQIYPAKQTSVDVQVTLFPRKSIDSIGFAPLTSMYFSGENNQKETEDFRNELHDSDGLLMHTEAGEWIWRPLRNTDEKSISSFNDNNPRGFGLMQRDRSFASYQDLEALYHKRPSYWIEPFGSWGEGRVELVEIPTTDETHDNIVCYWRPHAPLLPGERFSFSYNIKALGAADTLHPGGKAVNTFIVPARASGSNAPSDPSLRRFIIDFSGGDLEYYQDVPHLVELVPTTTTGKIVHTFLVPNPENKGFRAAIDIQLAPNTTTDLRAYLRAGPAALTETWIYPWAQK